MADYQEQALFNPLERIYSFREVGKQSVHFDTTPNREFAESVKGIESPLLVYAADIALCRLSNVEAFHPNKLDNQSGSSILRQERDKWLDITAGIRAAITPDEDYEIAPGQHANEYIKARGHISEALFYMIAHESGLRVEPTTLEGDRLYGVDFIIYDDDGNSIDIDISSSPNLKRDLEKIQKGNVVIMPSTTGRSTASPELQRVFHKTVWQLLQPDSKVTLDQIAHGRTREVNSHLKSDAKFLMSEIISMNQRLLSVLYREDYIDEELYQNRQQVLGKIAQLVK